MKTEHDSGKLVDDELRDLIETLVAAGLAAWNGKKLGPIQLPAINRGDKLASDLVVEMREG